MGYKIIDNFLPETEFKAVQEYFLSNRMPWYFNDHVVYGEGNKEKNQYQFVHVLYMNNQSNGLGVAPIQGILDKLDILALIRAKINFQPVREAHYLSGHHIDNTDFVKNNIPYTVAIFYLTTNNGTTLISTNGKDGVVNTVENRMLLLSGDTIHEGCSSTDVGRYVLNLNFINEETKYLYSTDNELYNLPR